MLLITNQITYEMKENIPVTGIGDESSDIEDKSMNYGNENPDFQDASNFTNHIWMTRNVMEIVARGTKHHSRALYNVCQFFLSSLLSLTVL